MSGVNVTDKMIKDFASMLEDEKKATDFINNSPVVIGRNPDGTFMIKVDQSIMSVIMASVSTMYSPAMLDSSQKIIEDNRGMKLGYKFSEAIVNMFVQHNGGGIPIEFIQSIIAKKLMADLGVDMLAHNCEECDDRETCPGAKTKNNENPDLCSSRTLN